MILMLPVVLAFAFIAGIAALMVLAAATSAVGGALLASGESIARELSRRRAFHKGTAAGAELEWARPTAMPDYAPCIGFETQAPRPAYAGTWVYDPLQIEAPVLLEETAPELDFPAATGALSPGAVAAGYLDDQDAYILIG